MTKIILKGFDPEPKIISFTTFIKNELDLSLTDAKAITDDLAAGEEVEISLHKAKVQYFIEQVKEFGVNGMEKLSG